MANATADVTAQAVVAAIADQRKADANVNENKGEIHQGDTWFDFGKVDGVAMLLVYMLIVRPIRRKLNGKS